MGAYVVGQTAISVFVIKVSSKFLQPDFIILIPHLICPMSHAKGAAEKHSNNVFS